MSSATHPRQKERQTTHTTGKFRQHLTHSGCNSPLSSPGLAPSLPSPEVAQESWGSQERATHLKHSEDQGYKLKWGLVRRQREFHRKAFT